MKIARYLGALGLTCALGLSTAKAETYNFAHFLPESYPAAKWEQIWVDEVAERTDGDVQINIFWAGQLGGAGEIAKLVGSGAVPFGTTAIGYTPQAFPLTSAAGTLVSRTFLRPEDSWEVAQAFYANPSVQGELQKNNIRIQHTQLSNPYRITCKTPVRNAEDLKGLRVRSTVPLISKYIQSIGATPVSVPLAEMYDALSKGTIDCALMPHDQILGFKINEVASNAIDFSLGSHATWQILVNKDVWEGLSEKNRKAIQDASDAVVAAQLAELKELEAKRLSYLGEAGVEVIDFDHAGVDEMALDDVAEWEASLPADADEEDVAALVAILRAEKAQHSGK